MYQEYLPKGAPTWNQNPVREKSPKKWNFLSLAFGNVPSLHRDFDQNNFAATHQAGVKPQMVIPKASSGNSKEFCLRHFQGI